MLQTSPDQVWGAGFGTLPGPARQWLETLDCGRDPAPAEQLRRSAGALVRSYARGWGAELDESLPCWPAYENRVVGTLAYHWWRHGELGFRPLEEVVTLLAAGRLAYGQMNADVVRDSVLA